MEIKPLESNERALVWKTPSDYADEESKAETLCIKFGKPESKFKIIFWVCSFVLFGFNLIVKSANKADRGLRLLHILKLILRPFKK